MKALWLSLLLCLAVAPATASDGVLAVGKLSDTAFYNLATCGAAKGQKCQGPNVRWPKREIAVGIHPDPGTMDHAMSARVSKALNAAIATINAAGAAIMLHRDDRKRRPDILLRRVSLREGEETKGIPDVPDGERIGIGMNTVWWRNGRDLTKATILISAHIKRDAVASVVLEEVFQTLGFRYDVEGAYYRNRSILAQDSNSVSQIKGQDAAILRLHYPPANN